MSVKRFKTNPFLENMVVPIKGRKVQLSRMGSDGDVLINQETGEIRGTHVTTYKKVDASQFVKLFSANIGLTFDLSSAGIKALNVLIWEVQHSAISKDLVDFDSMSLEDFLDAHKDSDKPIKMSIATFKRGINELEKAQIIAKAMRKGRYYINPNFVFNGDRIAFTTVLEKQSNNSNSNSDQMKLEL